MQSMERGSRCPFCQVVMLMFSIWLSCCRALTINSGQRTAPSILKEVTKLLSPKHPDTIDVDSSTATATATATASSKISSPQVLPWTASINPSRDLTYMPMLNKQLERMAALGMEQVPLKDSFVFRSSTIKPARIGNMEFKNDKFRKVRMTYFDAGDAVQVFNTVWYPNFEYDLPMLGVDLISLGKNRVLTVVDFQPLHPTEEYHKKHNEHLTSIRNKYKDLQGTLSGKIYDDTSFFSKNMLFGRFTDESKISSCVKPAFVEYLDAYLGLMESATPDHSQAAMEMVKTRQSKYDAYSALKDPAVGLFEAYFGKKWSDEYVDNFLFSLSGNSHSLKAVQAHNVQVNPQTGEVMINGGQGQGQASANPHANTAAVPPS